MSSEYAIQMSNISKQFGGVYALNDVSFSLKKGTVHALLGENGAGKSTLMRILTGVVSKDAGTIFLDGEEVEINNYAHAQNMGIAFVPQELAFVNYFTVAENIFLGKEPRIKGTNIIDWKFFYSETRKLLDELKIKMNPKAKAGDLSVSEQQMMVIARILSLNANVIIFDEPTARLGYHEIKDLLEYIRYLRDNGKSIIYISHRLEEIFQVADEVTILRDGCVVGTASVSEITEKSLIHMMVNRDVEFTDEFVNGRTYGDEILKVQGLTRSVLVKDVSFSLRRGEVLGFFGLVGAGRTEIIRSMLGIDRMASGKVIFEGKECKFKNIRESIRAGIALVPEERRKQGLVLSLPIRVNVTLGNLKRFTKGLVLQFKREKKEATECVDKVKLLRRSIEQKVSALSGGNQQKVVLAKLLARGNIKVYIFDEPTRGIDVGAKSEIYKLIADIVRHGTPCIVVSSEIPEIQALCDRVVIINEGKVSAILDRSQIKDSNEILKYAIGG